MPIESINLQTGTPIRFKHPAIDRTLEIGTGVNGLTWAYKLNTNVQSTYGGEVVQVLSAYVDAIQVHGSTTDNRQLRQIADWFLEYMQLAGLHNRNEQYITMEYPERGWSFWIQVTALPDFHYNIAELAIEWSITAEIVADNDTNYLSQMTMSQYTESAFDPSMWDLKFMADDPRNQEYGLDPVALGHKMGDNFQSLLGAWATGDFAHFAFDATGTLKGNNLKNSKDYWTQIYGSDSIGVGGQGTTSQGSAGVGNYDNTSVVGIIANAFTAKGMPPELGVAAAMQESGLDPDKYQYPVGPFPYNGTAIYHQTGAGLFQTTKVGGPEDAYYKKAIDGQPNRITQFYPAQKQAEFAAARFASANGPRGNLGQWAFNAQGPADEAGYVAAVNANVARAKRMIQQVTNTSSGNPQGVTAARFALSQLGVPYVFGAESPGIGFDCSGLCQWAYSKAGVAIPRTSQAQFSFCHPVNIQNIAVGDLVFCAGSDGTVSSPGHVVMYIGNGQCVAAPSSGRTVEKEALSGFTGTGFSGIGRVP